MSISVETFYLDPAAPGTLQARIQQVVAQGFLAGRFRPGERLPSSRPEYALTSQTTTGRTTRRYEFNVDFGGAASTFYFESLSRVSITNDRVTGG